MCTLYLWHLNFTSDTCNSSIPFSSALLKVNLQISVCKLRSLLEVSLGNVRQLSTPRDYLHQGTWASWVHCRNTYLHREHVNVGVFCAHLLLKCAVKKREHICCCIASMPCLVAVLMQLVFLFWSAISSYVCCRKLK